MYVAAAEPVVLTSKVQRVGRVCGQVWTHKRGGVIYQETSNSERSKGDGERDMWNGVERDGERGNHDNKY